jgi:hypothetical protein
MGPPPADGVMKPFAMTTAPQDFEMKRLAWLLVAELADDEAGIAVAKQGFLACMLAFLAPLTLEGRNVAAVGGTAAVTRWSRSQLRDLQELALRLLMRLAPLCPQEMATLGACEAAVSVMSVESPADDGLRAAAISLAVQLTALEGFVGRLGGAGAVEAALGAFEGVGGGLMEGSPSGRSGRGSGGGSGSGGSGGSASNGHGGVIPADAGYFTDEPSGDFLDSPGGGGPPAARGVHPGSSEDPVKLAAAALLAALCGEHGGAVQLLHSVVTHSA